MISVNKNIIPFFSVIVTCYNRGLTLQRALISLQSQSEQDWECLIVDDGSNDSSAIIAKRFCDSDRRFRYLYHSNRKQALSKNAGMLAASGIYITFLDSDDEYEIKHLELRKRILCQNPEVELLHGGVRIIGNEYVPDMNNPNKMIHLSDCVIGGTFFVYKNSALAIGGFNDVVYGDDTVFFEKAVKNGRTIAKINYPTYIYHRNSDDSLCNTINQNN
ncbi:MAG: glycosyltransferase [Candidatus Kapabacteria bacterium]|nr:glycosyltransferase [Ignavibacteriota bacterium]MCW5885449.1 glycosyltransferase [Candidatus Kapabacteria bacterium]